MVSKMVVVVVCRCIEVPNRTAVPETVGRSTAVALVQVLAASKPGPDALALQYQAHQWQPQAGTHSKEDSRANTLCNEIALAGKYVSASQAFHIKPIRN